MLARFPRSFASLLVAVGAPSTRLDMHPTRATAILLIGAITITKVNFRRITKSGFPCCPVDEFET
jgi:hypothetical protein